MKAPRCPASRSRRPAVVNRSPEHNLKLRLLGWHHREPAIAWYSRRVVGVHLETQLVHVEAPRLFLICDPKRDVRQLGNHRLVPPVYSFTSRPRAYSAPHRIHGLRSVPEGHATSVRVRIVGSFVPLRWGPPPGRGRSPQPCSSASATSLLGARGGGSGTGPARR
jgi:hypothetical protein